MSYGWARPGVKCVCVDAWFPPGPRPLSEGAVYEISSVVREGAKVAFYLVGLDRPEYARLPEGRVQFGRIAYGASRFRPLVQQRTEAEDVAQFRHLLDVPADLEAVR